MGIKAIFNLILITVLLAVTLMSGGCWIGNDGSDFDDTDDGEQEEEQSGGTDQDDGDGSGGSSGGDDGSDDTLPDTHVEVGAFELYGTFHAMGVIVSLEEDADPEQNAVASVEYRENGQEYRAGYPLARVADDRFVGSLFWLDSGTAYDVRVTLSDVDSPIDGEVLEATAATRTDIAVPDPLRAYYVSADGSGSGSTPQDPCSLSDALESAQPGEEIVLRAGIYYIGDLSIPRSGTSAAPIVIRSYPGEKAIFDGSDPDSFAWTNESDGIWRTTINTQGTHLVCANGERLYPYQSPSDLEDLVGDLPGFYCDGSTLYVHLAGDANPNDADMVISRYNRALLVEQNFVFFLDLTFRYYGQGSWAKALYLNNANNVLIQGCTFAINDLGIGLKRDSNRNVIQDCEFYDTTFDWPWDSVKGGSQLETGGVRFYSPADGRGNIIRRNTFHDYFDGFGVCPSSSAAVTNETDVYENLIYRIGDDGVEADGQSSNVRLWDNTFHDVLMGISLAPVYTGPTYALRNVIYRTGVGNNDYSGSPFKFNSGYDKSGPIYLFHNTCDAVLPDNNGIYIKAPGSWEIIVSRNNIYSGTNYALNNYNQDQPLDLDYDNLYTTNPDEFVYWGDGPERHMYDLATFQQETGQELHGSNLMPEFLDVESGDYALDSGSGLIDMGITLPGINDDYAGAAPDLGAIESSD